jgi:hypothetical protein
MKKMLGFIVSLCLMAAMLSACGPVFKTEYSYVPPRSDGGKMCVAQCIQGKNACEQSCEMKNQNCKLRAHQDALTQFEMYKQEQKRIGKPVERSVDSFDRSYACSASCGCDETYNSCYSTCGGKVIETQVCVAFCDKA